MYKFLSVTILALAIFSIGYSVRSSDIQEIPILDNCYILFQGDIPVYNSCDPAFGSTITTIEATDTLYDSRPMINTNFSNLNTDKLENSDLSGGTGIGYSTGAITFDCSEVEGTGINCSGESITLDATGDWTGTFDGTEGYDYLLQSQASTTYLTPASASTSFLAIDDYYTASGTVETGNLYQMPFYSATGTTLTATSAITLSDTGLINFNSKINVTNEGFYSHAGTQRVLVLDGNGIGDYLEIQSNDAGTAVDLYARSSVANVPMRLFSKGTGDIEFYTNDVNRVTIADEGLTVSGGATSTYLSVTTSSALGIVNSGTWQGTAIADAYITSASVWDNKWDLASSTMATPYGGTGTTTWTTNDIIYYGGSTLTADNSNFNYNGDKLTISNASSTQLSVSGNIWFNGLSNTILALDMDGKLEATTTPSGGSGTINSGTLGQIPYYAGAGTELTATSGIFINDNGVLIAGIASSTKGRIFYNGTPAPNEFLFTIGHTNNQYVMTFDEDGDLAIDGHIAASTGAITTISNSTWNGVVVGTQYGGTGQNFNSSNGLILLTAGTASAVATSTLNIDFSNMHGTIDMSDQTNLAGGTNITLSGDTLNVDDAFLINNADESYGYTLTLDGLIATSSASTTALIVSESATLNHLATAGGSVIAVNDVGLVTATSTPPNYIRGVISASSTDYKNGEFATSTFEIPEMDIEMFPTKIICKTDAGTSSIDILGQAMLCDIGGTTVTSIASSSVTANIPIQVDILSAHIGKPFETKITIKYVD